jgi:protein-tyrosine phosphatase
MPLSINWEESKSNTNKKPKYFIVDIYEGNSETPWYTRSNITNFDQDEFYNFKLDTEYQYQVTAYYSDTLQFKSEKKAFRTTNKGPRNLYVNNVMNIRDLGGYGIKQGLIYRSGRFNEDEDLDGKSLLDEQSKDVLLNVLKIKTEIDLRRPGENGNIKASPLGEAVSYNHLPMYYGGENVLTYVGERSSFLYDNPARIKEFFELLSDRNNYPIDFHCAIGKDRTGCMAYLIEALCGMEEEYLYRDYLFSNFAKISGICKTEDIDDRYGATLKAYEGETLQEKTYNYLNKVIGVSTEKLDAIKDILIDK